MTPVEFQHLILRNNSNDVALKNPKNAARFRR